MAKREKIKLNNNQNLIAENFYLKLNESGKICESVEQMFLRISKYIAGAENLYNVPQEKILKLIDNFYEIQSNFEFLCGMTLRDRGRNKLMASCYVLPLEDSLESIYHTLYESVQLHRLGAGIGYDFSPLRPEGSLIKSTGKESSGPISFMRLYDFSSEIILNRGSVRHAGHMAILRCDHPDIEKFINAKTDYNQLTNFNLSIAITDKFMKAYRNNLSFDLIDPNTKLKVRQIKAKELMEKISYSIYNSGEPGIIFIDEINRKNTLPKLGKITATNLCGEQPLLPYEACNLGSINLVKFISQNKVNYSKLEKVIRLAIRYLDNTVDLSYYVLPKIKDIVLNGNRKIGLGVMGWADLLAELNIPYDSSKALDLASRLMKFIQEVSRDESSKIGKEKGNFKNFDKSIFKKSKYKYMRNASITTISPTGTISLFADCNGGIEPFFALSYKRLNMEALNKNMTFINKILEKKLKEEWIYSKELIKKIQLNGSIEHIDEIPKRIKRIFRTSLSISPIWHLKMQAAFQKYTDNAVSKTVNVKHDTNPKEIEKIIARAYLYKLKGLTIFRNKSRDKQVLNI